MLTRWRILAVLLIGLLPATGVWAHANLTSSQPAQGESVAKSPDQLILTFSETIQPISKVELIDPKGNMVQGLTIKVEGKKLTATLPKQLDNGTYRVKWTSAAEDGHVEDGEYTFSVGESSGTASDVSASSKTGWGKEAAAVALVVVFLIFVIAFVRSQRRK